MAKGERGGVEHLTTESDDENLADQNTAGNEIKTFTAFQAKRTLSGLESACIEHVPELQHHERGEEKTEVVERHAAFLQVPEHNQAIMP